MYVRTKQKPNGKTSVQIVESYRQADKVRQRIVRHVGQAVTEREVEELKRLAETIICSPAISMRGIPLSPWLKRSRRSMRWIISYWWRIGPCFPKRTLLRWIQRVSSTSWPPASAVSLTPKPASWWTRPPGKNTSSPRKPHLYKKSYITSWDSSDQRCLGQ